MDEMTISMLIEDDSRFGGEVVYYASDHSTIPDYLADRWELKSDMCETERFDSTFFTNALKNRDDYSWLDGRWISVIKSSFDNQELRMEFTINTKDETITISFLGERETCYYYIEDNVLKISTESYSNMYMPIDNERHILYADRKNGLTCKKIG